MDIAGLILDRRAAHGLSQRQLALRAGTTQAVISRIERGHVAPTFSTVEAILDSLGEELVVGSSRRRPEADPGLRRSFRALSPSQRLERAIDWNEFSGEIGRAGAVARSE